MPARLGDYQPGLSFHRVETPSYPLFREPQYLLSLANKIVQVSRAEDLDIVHAHYAIPHATAGYLARQILAAAPGACVPRVITTLHGTDITLLGSDRSYSEIVAFSIEQSDGVTAVSESLKADTYRELGVPGDIRVIPNFVDCSIYKRRDATKLRERLAPNGQKLIVHVSNFRPVKRVPLMEVFARWQEGSARLLMVGDGPDPPTRRSSPSGGVAGGVEFLASRISCRSSASDVFLLPSSQKAGLAVPAMA
jgi:N-acetyl-alpha-D-glucosaminyl L-malate synthase BshA